MWTREPKSSTSRSGPRDSTRWCASSRDPNAVVLDLGAGLDGRVFRVDPSDTADWYDIDYPEVVELRREVMPARAKAHDVGADLTDPGWLSDIPAERPAMLVADGLLPFLAQGDFVTLMNRLTAHFPHGELALNGYSTYATWIFRHTRAMAPIVCGMINPGFNEPRRLEGWVDRLRLVEEEIPSPARPRSPICRRSTGGPHVWPDVACARRG